MVNFRRFRKRIKNWFIYQITKLGYRFLLSIKRETALKFLRSLGLLGYYLVRSERRKTIRHLKMVFENKFSDKKIENMAKDVFVNLGRNMVDAFRVTKFNSQNIDQYVKANGLEKIDRALGKGRGVLALTGHVGNWELLGAYLAMKGYPLHVIGAPIYDPRLDELVTQNRIGSGLKYIQRGSEATRAILRALKKKEMIGILIDQDTRQVNGVFVNFLGKEAYTPVGPVMISMKTGAPLLPMGIHLRNNDTHQVEVGDEIELKLTGNREQDLTQNTLQCSKEIEKYILKHPTQWVWMHQRWRTKKK